VAKCTCGLDYVGPGDAGACAWGGGLLDPGFQNTPPNAWTTASGAVLEPATAGDLDPGDVHFDQGTICTTEGTVTQTFNMPAFSSAEPLALRVVGKLTCSSGDQGCLSEGNSGPNGEVHGFGVALNQGYELLPMVDAYSSQLLCLGERAYGGPLDVVLSAEGNNCSDGSLQYDGILDHADVEPSSVCPLPEVITDADFEATPVTGWSLSAGGGTAEVIAGAGTLGTRGGHIAASTLGDSPTFTQMLSVPASSSIPHPALSIDYNAQSGDAMQLSMNGQEFGELVGTGASSTVHVCLPSWATGLALPVTLGIDARGDGSMGANTPIFNADFTFDNLAWLTSSTCPVDADIIDPSFELTGSWRPWILRTFVGFGGTTIATIAADAAAHQGAQSLHLSTTTICATSSAFTYFTIPAGTATAGPALTFWYKWSPSGTSTFFSNLVSGQLASTTTWTQKTVCLDPKHVGRADQISFQVEGNNSGGCNVQLPAAASAFVDDLALTTSASCPH
jgi:hypothetical protein